MTRRILPLLLAVVTVTMASCRVDVAIDVDVEQNGSGTVTVSVVTDAEVVDTAPGLADDVRVDDLRAAGWTVDGPTDTADGGLQMTLTRGFSTPEQATALLATINGPAGPLRTLAVSRSATDDSLVFTVTGALGVEGGLLAFTDPDLLASLGVSPYAEQIATAGVDPAQTVGIEVSMALPGEVQTTSGQIVSEVVPTPGTTGTTGTTVRDVIVWTVPLDDSRIDVGTVAEESLRRGALWSILSGAALVVLVLWVIGSAILIGWVVRLRRQRGTGAARRTDRATPLT